MSGFEGRPRGPAVSRSDHGLRRSIDGMTMPAHACHANPKSQLASSIVNCGAQGRDRVSGATCAAGEALGEESMQAKRAATRGPPQWHLNIAIISSGECRGLSDLIQHAARPGAHLHHLGGSVRGIRPLAKKEGPGKGWWEGSCGFRTAEKDRVRSQDRGCSRRVWGSPCARDRPRNGTSQML